MQKSILTKRVCVFLLGDHCFKYGIQKIRTFQPYINRWYCDWLKMLGDRSHVELKAKSIQEHERSNLQCAADRFNVLLNVSKTTGENASQNTSIKKLTFDLVDENSTSQNATENDEYYKKYSEIFDGRKTDSDSQYQAEYFKIFGKHSNCENEVSSALLEKMTADTCEKRKENQSSEKGTALTHTDKDGRATMVDVGDKPDSKRTAVAMAIIHLGERAFNLVKENKMKKGDVLSVSQIAGIMAAKQTSSLIPLCHNIGLNKVTVDLELDDCDFAIKITSSATTTGKTGVEMEALVAANITALTVYDMCKAVTHDMTVTDVRLLEKSGGTRGTFSRK